MLFDRKVEGQSRFEVNGVRIAQQDQGMRQVQESHTIGQTHAFM